MYNEFVQRYYKDLKQESLLVCKKRKLDKHIGEQMTHDTFHRVRKTTSFDASRVSTKEPRKSILAWLFRIQSRLFYDFHKANKSKSEKVNFYLDEMKGDLKIPSGSSLSKQKEIAERIFSKLSKKEKIVVLKDLEFKRFRKYHQTDIIEDLAEELGVKKDSIRKIRQRAKNKIQDAINEINGKK